MTQQMPFDKSNERYKRKLFYYNGFEYVEVKARIVEPYQTPIPQINNKEIKVINAPSHFLGLGVSSYRCTVNLLFYDKQSYNDYLSYVGWTHKFYDEKGSIFIGTVDNIRPQTKEANKKYMVEVNLILIKKDVMDRKIEVTFQDIEESGLKDDIIEMANLGLVQMISSDGRPVLFFKPTNFITRAEFVTFMNRTRRYIQKIIRE